MNADGFADLVIGAIYYDAGASDEGNAFVYHGSASGLPAAPTRTLDNPANDAGSEFGASVASAGDTNADGYADLIVGAPAQGAMGQGSAFVYFGGSSGVPAAPSVSLSGPTVVPSGEYGAAVEGDGDVNGDGYSDVGGGAPAYSFNGNAYVHLGGASGPAASAATSLTGVWGGRNRSSPVRGSGLAVRRPEPRRIRGPRRGITRLPRGRRSLGGSRRRLLWWVHGHPDGVQPRVRRHFGDVCAFRPQHHVERRQRRRLRRSPRRHLPRIRVRLYGSVSGLPAASSARVDVPGAAVLIGGECAAVGDIDGDGRDDVVIATHRQDHGTSDEGAAHVYHSTATGIPAAPAIENPTNQANGWFGVAVSSR